MTVFLSHSLSEFHKQLNHGSKFLRIQRNKVLLPLPAPAFRRRLITLFCHHARLLPFSFRKCSSSVHFCSFLSGNPSMICPPSTPLLGLAAIWFSLAFLKVSSFSIPLTDSLKSFQFHWRLKTFKIFLSIISVNISIVCKLLRKISK